MSVNKVELTPHQRNGNFGEVWYTPVVYTRDGEGKGLIKTG
jgi:hypothetical protein